ncbi:hypothetical protein C0J52_19940 [Blattella germanica]|nr:hypothetical protein C0J52_19940 [Blattella germanica]
MQVPIYNPLSSKNPCLETNSLGTVDHIGSVPHAANKTKKQYVAQSSLQTGFKLYTSYVNAEPTSQNVLPGQLMVDVARSRRGFAIPRCTTQPQRQPIPTSATTSGLSTGRDTEGARRQPQVSVPTPQSSVSNEGPSQNRAPYLGGGESQNLYLLRVPPPQEETCDIFMLHVVKYVLYGIVAKQTLSSMSFDKDDDPPLLEKQYEVESTIMTSRSVISYTYMWNSQINPGLDSKHVCSDMPHIRIQRFDRMQIVGLLSTSHTQQDVTDWLEGCTTVVFM